MKHRYVIGIDQSTQGTKALLLDAFGQVRAEAALPHRQLVNAQGWISHDLKEILTNTKLVVQKLLRVSGVLPTQIVAVGLCNQRETTAAWNRRTGEPLADAVVWQCGRAQTVVQELQREAPLVKQKTGLLLSAYFPAAKMAWLLQNVAEVRAAAEQNELCFGTIDSWLLFSLTKEHIFRTDFSNASRTQLLNLRTLRWDEDLCAVFSIPQKALAEIYDSDALFGTTQMDGLFPTAVPICAVLGDSHASLFGQACWNTGMAKATYGTGSSIMMQTGLKPIFAEKGVATSIAWRLHGQTAFVLEGNLNYTGAVITWLKDCVGLIGHPRETEQLARCANQADQTYLIPAFTGLGALYRNEQARAAVIGMGRTTGKAELVRAALECIAYQVTDVVQMLEQASAHRIPELRVDGGPTSNAWLMQFQSDILEKTVLAAETKNLSGFGAAWLAGISAGFYQPEQLQRVLRFRVYHPVMEAETRCRKYAGWKRAVSRILLTENK